MVSHTIAIGAEPVPPHGVPAPPTELSPEEADAFVAALPTDQRLIFLFDSLPPGDLRSRVGFRIQDLTLTDPAPALSLFFRTSDPEIWGPLSYALSRSADASVVDAMVDLFTSGQQSRQRANADAVLSNISNPAAAPRLMAQFDLVGESTTHRELRAALARGLGTIGTPEAVHFLFQAAHDDPNPRRVEVGIESGIASITSPNARPALLDLLASNGLGESAKVRWLTLAALRHHPDPAVVVALRHRAPLEASALRTAMQDLAEALEAEIEYSSSETSAE